MAQRLGPTPLLAVEAVALDLETTGLDPRTARIVQIGAVVVRRGAVAEGERFSLLVDPGAPIPAAATAIHGISDAHVADAAKTAEALAALSRFVGDRPIVGHAVGYDMAVLSAEARRLKQEPLAPPNLCTRLLAEVAAPALPDFTLETLGAWLGVEPEERHNALGDAGTAAQIFLALLPHLRTRGVRTWAEAERAMRSLPCEPTTLAAAVGAAAPARRESEPVASIDSYAYRHRVGDVMTSPPRFLDGDRPLREAVRVMAEERISSVLVGGEAGPSIVTERDILRALAAGGEGALDRMAGEAASRPLQCVRAEDFVHHAIGRMARLKVRHLGVVDAEGRLVGALTARDLLRLRASEALLLGDAIETAADVAALSAAWAPLAHASEALVAEGVSAVGVAAVISEELAAATRRAAELAEAELAAEGFSVPCAYTVLVLGSAGRGESLLALDQDNAIIFAEGAPGGAQDAYFARLGARLADMLDAVGIPYCRGGVMAREQAWRGSLDTWRKRVGGWLARSNPQDLLSVDIFFDARAVYGDMRLADALMSEAHGKASRAPQFIKLLAAASPEPPAAVGLFGRLKSENGRLDLKRAAVLPIVSAARLLAMRYGVDRRSTPARLSGVLETGRGGAADLAAIIAGHEAVLAAILRQQIRDIHAGISPSNRVEAARLKGQELEGVKDALRAVPELNELVRDMLF